MHETSDDLLKKTLKFTSTKYILKARRDRKHFTRNNHLANRFLFYFFFQTYAFTMTFRFRRYAMMEAEHLLTSDNV